MIPSPSGMSNDSRPTVITSRLSDGDGVSDRLSLSEITSLSSIGFFGFSQSLIHPQNIFVVFELRFSLPRAKGKYLI